MMRATLAAAVAISWLSAASTMARASPPEAVEIAEPSFLWLAMPFIPSPELAVGEGRAGFGLRWQVTPLLYSWGVDRRISRWRSFLVDPFARHVGSVEAFLSPEVLVDARLFLMRPGVRVYLPLMEHGEMLSTSLGISYQHVGSVDSMAIELGMYALFGIVGLQVSHAPGPATPSQTVVTLSLRYF